ncbi:hypothetical protein AwDysgo_06630 [Bacteroidales bacterium]|nr:hypothetical protein AwDysgo_06630 [Bacteroidales bacterium]
MILQLHIYLGIASSLILFIVCITGAIYSFKPEIEEAIEPHKYKIEASFDAQEIHLDFLLQKFEQQIGKGKIRSVLIPADINRSYLVNVLLENPIEKAVAPASRGTNYLLNPYTGESLGTSRGPATDFFFTVFKLHRWLLQDTNIGRPIVGTAVIFFIVVVISGFIIWIPQKIKNWKAWKAGLKIKCSGNKIQIARNLHTSLGFYAAGLLLVMALTGLTWSFPWYRKAFFYVAGVEMPIRKAESSKKTDTVYKDQVNLSAYIKACNEALPYRGNCRITLPSPNDSTVLVSKSRAGFFAFSGVDRVTMDKSTAAIIEVDMLTEKSLGIIITSSIKSIHTGEIFGTFSKLLYLIASLIGSSLPITAGVFMYSKWKKRRLRA